MRLLRGLAASSRRLVPECDQSPERLGLEWQLDAPCGWNGYGILTSGATDSLPCVLIIKSQLR